MARKPAAEKIDGDYMMSGEMEEFAEEYTEELIERAEVAGSIASPTRALQPETLKKGAVQDLSALEQDNEPTGENINEGQPVANSPEKSSSANNGGSSKPSQKPKGGKGKLPAERRNCVIIYNVPKELYVDFMTCLHNCRHIYKNQSDAFEHILKTFVGEIKPTLGAFFNNARTGEMIDYQAKVAGKKKSGKG